MEQLDQILTDVAELTGVSDELILGLSRLKQVVAARHLTMYVMHETGQHSLSAIGEFLGRDHTSVIHGVKRTKSAMAGSTKAARALKEQVGLLRSKSTKPVSRPVEQHCDGFQRLIPVPWYLLDMTDDELRWLEVHRGSYVSYCTQLETYLVQVLDLVKDAASNIVQLGASERMKEIFELEAKSHRLISITIGGRE